MKLTLRNVYGVEITVTITNQDQTEAVAPDGSILIRSDFATWDDGEPLWFNAQTAAEWYEPA